MAGPAEASEKRILGSNWLVLKLLSDLAVLEHLEQLSLARGI